MTHAYEYPRPSLTVDVILYRWHSARLEVLLIERAHAPFEGCWALPGGFVDSGETPEAGAQRELLEETGVTVENLWPVGVFGAPGRDPRGWTVGAAFLALAPPGIEALAGDDARAVRWVAVDDLPEMAFDHSEILAAARQTLRDLSHTSTAVFTLLPPKFRTKQARFLYSQIWQMKLKPGAFKSWIRRRAMVLREGPAVFSRTAAPRPDWCR